MRCYTCLCGGFVKESPVLGFQCTQCTSKIRLLCKDCQNPCAEPTGSVPSVCSTCNRPLVPENVIVVVEPVPTLGDDAIQPLTDAADMLATPNVPVVASGEKSPATVAHADARPQPNTCSSDHRLPASPEEARRSSSLVANDETAHSGQGTAVDSHRSAADNDPVSGDYSDSNSSSIEDNADLESGETPCTDEMGKIAGSSSSAPVGTDGSGTSVDSVPQGAALSKRQRKNKRRNDQKKKAREYKEKENKEPVTPSTAAASANNDGPKAIAVAKPQDTESPNTTPSKNEPSSGEESNKNTVHVTLEVAVPASFGSDEQAKICVEFFDREPGPGIKELTRKRLESGYDGWTVTVGLRRDRLCALEYKYLIVRGKDEKTYEWIHRKTDSRNILNRKLMVSTNDIQKLSTLHQYDLAMLPKHYPDHSIGFLEWPKAIWKRIRNKPDRGKKDSLLEGDSLYGLQYMLPNISDCLTNDRMCGDDLVMRMQSIISFTEKSDMFFLDNSRTKTDKALLKEAVEGLLCIQLESYGRYPADAQLDAHRLETRRIICILIVLQTLFKMKPELEVVATVFQHLNWRRINIDSLLNEVKRNFQPLERLVTTVNQFMAQLAHAGKSIWLLAIPLYHALRAKTTTCHTLTYDRCEAFWGLDDDGLNTAVKKFKRTIFHFSDMDGFLIKLRDAIDQQPLSARTFVAALNADSLLSALNRQLLLPVDSYIGAIFYYWLYNTNTYSHLYKELNDALSDLLNFGEKFLQPFEKHKNERLAQESLTALEIVVNAKTELHAKVYFEHWRCWHLILHLIGQLQACAGMSMNVQRASTCAELITNEFNNWLYSRLPKIEHDSCMSAELEMWEALFAIAWHVDSTQKQWADKLGVILKNRVDKIPDRIKIDLFCSSEFKHPSLQAIFNAATLSAAERALQSPESMQLSSYCNLKRYGEIFSHVFKKEWLRHQTDRDKEKFILTWPRFSICITLSCGVHTQVLDNECQDHITRCVSLLENLCMKLKDGSLSYRDLDFLVQEKESFIQKYQQLCAKGAAAQPTEDPVQPDISEWLKVRLSEKQQFDEILSNLKILQSLCKVFKNARLQGLGDLSKDFNDVELRSLWMPDMSCSRLPPKALDCCLLNTLEFVTPAVLACVKQVHQSIMFNRMWQKVYQEYSNQTHPVDSEWECEIKDIMVNVWPNAFQQFQAIAERFQNDTETFVDADLVINACKHDMKAVGEEILLLAGADQAPAVCRHVQQYHELVQARKGATAILKIKDSLTLGGDFSALNFYAKSQQRKRCKLSSISKDLLGVSAELKDLNTAQKLQCLHDFSKCQQLIAWVKENISDTRELKVFVDFASIAAGEGDMEVEKVSCLHASLSGYAPLIYLPPSADLREVLEKCKSVWQSLETNPHLAEQLVDTKHNFEWVQHIKDSYGSVELTSLAQAKAINESGVFEIGHIQNDKSPQKFTLDGVLHVKVLSEPASRVSDPHRMVQPKGATTYTYSQLCELQSKLMLVAGRAEQDNPEVEAFMKMFTNATRLATAFIKVHEVGSVLFDTWRARFHCSNRDSVNVHVEFGLSQKMLRGHNVKTCQEHASELAKFIEECIQTWKRYMSEQRKQFPELNHFTTEQIVFLRKELAKLHHGNTCDKKVYPLVGMLRLCNMKELQDALAKSESAMHSRQLMMVTHNRQLPSTSEPAPVDESVLTDEQKQAFDAIADFGIDRELAFAALRACPNGSITDLVQWCNDRADENERPKLASASTKQNFPGPNAMSKTVCDLQSLINELLVCNSTADEKSSSTSSLCGQLTGMWNSYLAHASTSMKDFLCLEQLGHVLHSLAVHDDRKFKRAVPSAMERGRPHLIVCPHEKVLATVLSLYAVDVNCPTPTRNEVLLCSEDTSMEEVEIFFERAVNDDATIYCLAYAHRLSYLACGLVEKKIEQSSQTEKDHLIVIVCADEYNQSRMVAALDRYRNRNFHAEPEARLRAYVQRSVKVSESGKRLAASLDHEGCSARLVLSRRAGVGKTLYIQRAVQRLRREVPQHATPLCISISLVNERVNKDMVLEYLLKYCCEPRLHRSRVIHIDVAQEAQRGVDEFLFNLLILGSVCQREGYVWQRSTDDYYMVESTVPMTTSRAPGSKGQRHSQHSVMDLLPAIECFSPLQCQEFYADIEGDGNNQSANVNRVLMDDGEFRSRNWQRVFQYLSRFDGSLPFINIDPSQPEGTPPQMLRTLLNHCGINNPSWSELRYFVLFLNRQLDDCTTSSFCSLAAASELPGFQEFVVKFMLLMSKDFATRSLYISEESPHMKLSELQNQTDAELIRGMTMKHRWEHSNHPYLFFNPDHHTVTFLGFCIDPSTGNIVEPHTQRIMQVAAMSLPLFKALRHNGVDLSEAFEKLDRKQKIEKMCAVMGNSSHHDPDKTYELTSDNVKKILAIHMRFRCGIPVVIMGETGCGKTRLIKFMCDLQLPKGSALKNLVLVKVHGGVTNAHLKAKVMLAYQLAKDNRAKCPHVDTVLFLDEANTTDAIGLIKEIICDGSMDGEPLDMTAGLRVIAAVNPYRKHPVDMIKKLESAGLGYHVRADVTTDRFGSIPMRQLVYRVRALPSSMLPLVWDFGQLSIDVEEKYIKQMVQRHAASWSIPEVGHGLDMDMDMVTESVAKVLIKCQEFMRTQNDECSFVSLRDVDRTLVTMSWFITKCNVLRDKQKTIPDAAVSEEEKDTEDSEELDDLTWSLLLALSVCYHASLQPSNREAFRRAISPYFLYPLVLPGGSGQIINEIDRCQTLVIESLSGHIAKNIAHNQALKENIFMMIVCMELRIPLFLVGKPGSSKSLAKAILADAMQGEAAKSDLFKHFKQTYMVSFQCSPLATPEGIVGTFKQCARFQKSRKLDKFVSVVVLDEVGLAEDSKLMPLKTLHPLLEDGCDGDEIPEPYMKCAFIGISNWALDPAKMNRGILVQRGIPNKQELEESARGICQFAEHGLHAIAPIIDDLASAYLEIFQEVGKRREFFGLRDFYSLMKMVAYFAERNHGMPSPHELQHAVRRNFGGGDDFDVVKLFEKRLGKCMDASTVPYLEDHPPCDAIGLIQSSLSGLYTTDGGESRYLLILTENYSALNIIQSEVQKLNPLIIFGSKFPKDLEYTQVCRNINRIKVCMETGMPVLLLNLENLYESLYDALNQYYVYYGGKRFVDLGLGTHRVKCRVHEQFRLIVVAVKDDVYTKFPIPLINRLEKHYVGMGTMLTPEQRSIVRQLEQWAEDFARPTKRSPTRARSNSGSTTLPADYFVGYTPDTAATIVLQVIVELCAASDIESKSEEILNQAKRRLLLLATPEAVVRCRDSHVAREYHDLQDAYFKEQNHDSLISYLKTTVLNDRIKKTFVQVTTRSKLLSEEDINEIRAELSHRSPVCIELIAALQAIETEQQFSEAVRQFIHGKQHPATCTGMAKKSLLIVQCEAGHDNLKLVECARYVISREHSNAIQMPRDMSESTMFASTQDPSEKMHYGWHVILVIQLGNVSSFAGFHGGVWECIHIDDLRPRKEFLPAVHLAEGMRLSDLLGANFPTIPNVGGRDGPNVQAGTCNDERTNFDIYKLLELCLHEAASRLHDSSASSDRAVQRLSILHGLFSKHGSSEFKWSFALGVVELLRLHENERMTADMATRWLTNEVAAEQNVAKLGTFRRSLEDFLEKKIAPVSAAIIAYCDINNGLDLIDTSSSAYQPWVAKLWLQVLSSLGTRSSSMSLSIKDQQHGKLQVLCKSANGQAFVSKFPFSWLLKEKLDAIQGQSSALQDTRDLMETMLEGDAEIGVHLIGLSSEQLGEAITRYAHDYIFMSHRCSSEHEHQVVLRTLLAAMSLDDVNSISDVHLSFAEMLPKFVRLGRLLDVTPTSAKTGVLEKLNADAKGPCHRESKEMIDVIGLLEVLRTLEDTRWVAPADEWASDVHRLCTISDEILNICGKSDASMNQCNTIVKECRQMWSRLEAVRLFVVYIVIPEASVSAGTPVFDMKYAKLLYKSLRDEKDFNLKLQSSFIALEKFFSLCNSMVITAVYGKGASKKSCYSCDVTMTRSVLLPCRHTICTKCLQTSYQLNSQSMKCPQCSQQISFGESQISVNEIDRFARERLQWFMQRFTALFVRILSDLVFDGSDEPEPALIEHILSYVTMTTGPEQQHCAQDRPMMKPLMMQLSSYIDASLIDPTPVVRSFLLQVLLRSSKGVVDQHVTTYFEQALTVARPSGQAFDLGLCLLFINCMEDYYVKQVQTSVPEDLPASAKASKYLISSLQRGTAVWRIFAEANVTVSAHSLGTIATVRLGLILGANIIGKQILTKASSPAASRELDDVVQALRQLCDHAELQAQCHWPRRFLIKQMIHKHGASTIHAAMTEPSLRPLLPQELQEAAQGDSLPDSFVIGNKDSKHYSELRRALSASIVDGKHDALHLCLQALKIPEATANAITALAICSVVTRSYYNNDPDGQPKQQTIDMLVSYIQQSPLIRHKDLCCLLLRNSLPGKLMLTKQMGLQNAMIALLICRLWIELLRRSRQSSFIAPLSTLLSSPSTMQGKFFPTMPHDHFQDVKDVMQSMIRQKENLTPHACPNGHIYYIGNCGRANIQRRCPECTSDIGGANHTLAVGNSKIDPHADQTKPGHILGPVTAIASAQSSGVAERDLSPSACCIVRTILHMTMYASAAANGPQAVAALISPAPSDVLDFLWKHVCNDVRVLQRTVNKSLDDCLVLLNTLVEDLAQAPSSADCNWDSNAGRRRWEAALQSSLIGPSIQRCDEIISAGLEHLHADAQEAGSTVVLARLLAEPTDETAAATQTKLDPAAATTSGALLLLSGPGVWRYRESPCLDHFVAQFESHLSSLGVNAADRGAGSESRYTCLQKFLRSRHSLAAVLHLPDIMTLMALLRLEFSRKLSMDAVKFLTIDQFMTMHEHSCSRPLPPLIQHFIDAWNAVHDGLVDHRFWFDGQEFRLPPDVCSVRMSYESPLSILLCGTRGLTLCPVALITYLAKMHNDFLATHAQVYKQKLEAEILLADVRHAHLITANPDTDLVPIILANCEYSLKVGKGTEVHYNYDVIQQQVMERFVQHKPQLRLPSAKGNHGNISRFLLHEDLTNYHQLGLLGKLLPQEALPSELKKKVCAEYGGHVTDMSDSLILIDQVIGFLVTTHATQDICLWTYVQDTLRMGASTRVHSMLGSFRLKHIRALSLLLSMERTKVLVMHHGNKGNYTSRGIVSDFARPDQYPWQAWFDGVSDRYAEPVPDSDGSMKTILERLKKLHREHNSGPVLEILYEFIMLRLSSSSQKHSSGAAADDGEESYQQHYGLFDTLATYADEGEPTSSNQPGSGDSSSSFGAQLEQLAADCSTLQLRHAVPAWLTIFSISSSGADE